MDLNHICVTGVLCMRSWVCPIQPEELNTQSSQGPLSTCWTHLGIPSLCTQTNIPRAAFEHAEGVWLQGSICAHPALLEAEGERRKWGLGEWEGKRVTESFRCAQGVVATISSWCSLCVDMKNHLGVVTGSRVWGQGSVAELAVLCHSWIWENKIFPSLRLAGTQVNLKRHVNLKQ